MEIFHFLTCFYRQMESTKVMDELQKQETRNKKNKDVYDKLKGDLRMLKEQLQALQRALDPKVRRLGVLVYFLIASAFA